MNTKDKVFITDRDMNTCEGVIMGVHKGQDYTIVSIMSKMDIDECDPVLFHTDQVKTEEHESIKNRLNESPYQMSGQFGFVEHICFSKDVRKIEIKMVNIDVDEMRGIS